MDQLPLRVLYYGKDEPLPEQTRLQAGPLSLIFEAGDLRYIRLGDCEILRRVYVAIRDRNWGTVLPKLSNIQLQSHGKSFKISYEVENKQDDQDDQDDIDFFWKGNISGDEQGTLTFTMEGQARSTFWRNRIGFCVLHPVRECAGYPCLVEKVDGSVENGMFPKYISPHQPFMDMRSISHEVIPGLWAEVRFAGDIFEMEDQRNWSDGSYKTYCTPLRLPYPVEVKAGTKISQSVTLSLKGSRGGFQTRPYYSHDTNLTFSIGSGERPVAPSVRARHAVPPVPPVPLLPRLGLCLASQGQYGRSQQRPYNQKELSRLKALNLSHLRADINLIQPDYKSILRRAADESRLLGVPLEIALTLSDQAKAELRSLVSVLDELKPAIGTWLIFQVSEKSTSEKWVNLARESLRRYDSSAKIGAGTNVYFTELNRARPNISALDIVCYSINPQVHAFDNASLVETLETQASTLESARQFTAGLPIAVTPITLKPRFNPNATGPEPEPEPEPTPDELPTPVDVRQMSLFGACWTLGSLKYLSESGTFSLTYYETTGWLGVMERESGSPLPEQFRSLPGSVFPLYHVLADVGEFAGGEVIPTHSSHPLKIDGMAIRKNGKTRVLLANLSSESQLITVKNLSQRLQARHLNETNAQEAMLSPEDFRAKEGELLQASKGTLELSLLPYGIVRIDSV